MRRRCWSKDLEEGRTCVGWPLGDRHRGQPMQRPCGRRLLGTFLEHQKGQRERRGRRGSERGLGSEVL